VKAHSKFVKGDFGYGYGWWVAWGDYLASGRGGQMVRVVASRNTILVVTGNYYEYSDVEKWLLPVLIGVDDPRLADSGAVEELGSALASIQQDDATPVTPDPALASTVSGRDYSCASNPANIEGVRLDFTDPGQAGLSFTMSGRQFNWPVGVDGKFRLTPEGAAIRGSWKDQRTFQLIIFDIGVLTRQVQFEENTLQLTLPEAGLTITCQMQNP